jgi:hypothetical protein
MKPAVRYSLIGCAIFALLLAAGIAGIAWYVNAHKGELVAKAKAVRSDGANAGKDLDESRCADESLSRYRTDGGMVGGMKKAVFLGGCLETSQISDGFCADVPREEEFMRSATWRVEQCRRHGFAGDSNCPNILAEVQRYCYGPVRVRKLTAAAK